MSKEGELQEKLVEKISAKRASINKFASELERRSARLINLSIICTAITTVLVAGPALGGEKFTESAQNFLNLASDSYVWRVLCFTAGILSIAAAIASNMYKSHDIASRLAKAEATSALLDGLETSIEFGKLSMEEATKLYQQYAIEVPFIPEG